MNGYPSRAIARATTGTGATAKRGGTQGPSPSAQAASSRHAPPEQGQRPITAWQPGAACTGLPQDIFFPPEGERGRKLRRRHDNAKRICQACPVIESCRAHALDTAEQHGVWGATTPNERRRLIQARIRANTSTVPIVGDGHPTGGIRP